ncbi:hypothetical protein Tco_1450145 [Tanacetum coccineum]
MNNDMSCALGECSVALGTSWFLLYNEHRGGAGDLNIETRAVAPVINRHDSRNCKEINRKPVKSTFDVVSVHTPIGVFNQSSVNAELSQQVQAGMENMLKMITETIFLYLTVFVPVSFKYSEIDQGSGGIVEDIEKCKESALERKSTLEEEKERFQKAAYSVLDLLNNRDNN